MKHIIFLAGLALVLVSCKKEAVQKSPVAATDSKVFPQYVISDNRGEFYIEGTFNGKKICLSPTQPPADTFSNAYYYDTRIDLDQLNLIRANDERSAEMQIYFGQSIMLKRAIPYKLPHANLAKCEFTQFQFYDSWHRHGTENDASDDYTYQATTNTGMTLTVTSFTGDIIEGTFEGILRTNTGKVISVKDGSFKIKIYIVASGS